VYIRIERAALARRLGRTHHEMGHDDPGIRRGRFHTFSGRLVVDQSGTVSGSIDVNAASLDTENGRRDLHLRSPSFFGIATIRPSGTRSVRFKCSPTTASGSQVPSAWLAVRCRLFSTQV
jgi:hypothetical protein